MTIRLTINRIGRERSGKRTYLHHNRECSHQCRIGGHRASQASRIVRLNWCNHQPPRPNDRLDSVIHSVRTTSLPLGAGERVPQYDPISDHHANTNRSHLVKSVRSEPVQSRIGAICDRIAAQLQSHSRSPIWMRPQGNRRDKGRLRDYTGIVQISQVKAPSSPRRIIKHN